jgi:hypothetical protein
MNDPSASDTMGASAIAAASNVCTNRSWQPARRGGNGHSLGKSETDLEWRAVSARSVNSIADPSPQRMSHSQCRQNAVAICVMRQAASAIQERNGNVVCQAKADQSGRSTGLSWAQQKIAHFDRFLL